MTERLPVSVVICALNEEHRIRDSIESIRRNNPYEVIVVEGGSTDGTVRVAQSAADQVYSSENAGLGYKRAKGVELATQEYVLTLDADQVLADGALAILLDDLRRGQFAGVQASLQGLHNETYWERGMAYNVSRKLPSYPAPTQMIGTPALWRREV